ncbi:oxidoreductase domain-containing protein [Diaporthe amygdali]|uniref:oxidoreductase domain-containing protein n=1 Tax=Phomopsis amygdali TaxID=1214568 RepID=UPI0022FE7DD4|nr:oxidoreductase domain-containing protein [Diaporthe amygdali]KAJ0119280.1 oxidoreductase domain-containing protein [Diaporthe amygdali]
MLDFLKEKVSKKSDPRSDNARSHGIPEGEPVRMSYASRDVAIPADFLSMTAPPPDAQPVTISPVDWASSPLPEYEGLFAVVLDNVLSPSECQTLLQLAESSVDVFRMNSTGDHNPWKPAMVNAGNGFEVLETGYRNSDRLVWDEQEVVDRIWRRCLQGEAAEKLREKLDVLDGDEKVGACRLRGRNWVVENQRWEFRRLNQRMRFLKYGEGQFFRPHCDGAFSEEVDGKIFKTFFTLHLYLNDSVAEAGEDAELVGGATSFLSGNESRRVDVNPKAGRVLIFQHRRLFHSGDDVVEGTKYTMRTDIMYELIRRKQMDDEDKEEEATKEI